MKNSLMQEHALREMRQYGIAVSRDNYIEVNFSDLPSRWTPEHEAELPIELQDWTLFETDQSGNMTYTGTLPPR